MKYGKYLNRNYNIETDVCVFKGYIKKIHSLLFTFNWPSFRYRKLKFNFCSFNFEQLTSVRLSEAADLAWSSGDIPKAWNSVLIYCSAFWQMILNKSVSSLLTAYLHLSSSSCALSHRCCHMSVPLSMETSETPTTRLVTV